MQHKYDNQISENPDEVNMAAAGIMKFIHEYALFTNSTVNSYNRFGEFSVPRYITWSDTEEEQVLKFHVVLCRLHVVKKWDVYSSVQV